MAKRGRKSKNEKQDENVKTSEYFSNEQEEAVVRYLTAASEAERNEIYNQYLKFPLEKMTESIINRYKLYSAKMSYKELFDDTLSFLHMKISMFDPSRGKKSFSYFGTIIKRRLQNNRKKETKDKKKVVLYEDVYKSITQGDDIEEKEYSEDNLLHEFFKIIVDEIQDLLLEDNISKYGLKDSDVKVGVAILEITQNWERIYVDDTKKYNKNFVLECIRNMTLLNTTQIGQSLKFYKEFYVARKQNYLSDLEDDF
jgi:DNA-directed RNA polymerase specialized sigma subunit